MVGFESYCEPVEIDFEQLGQKGLYLIKGKTGAGKTTIFDGITYALYGESSGDDRDAKMLRSAQADETVDTEVQLDFVIDGKKYRITRNPEYEQKAKRGVGTSKKLASAKLEYLSEDDDRKPVQGTKAVEEAIKEIVKLSKAEFTQIAMIAQGKFEKFLLSETKDKIEIFRNIFDTNNYSKLQEKIKSDYLEQKKNCDKLTEQIKQYLGGITIPVPADSLDSTDSDNENLLKQEKEKIIEKQKKLDELQSTIYIEDNALVFLDSLVQEDEKLLNQLTTALEEKDAEILKNDQALENAKKRAEIVENIEEDKKQLASLKNQLPILKAENDKKEARISEKGSLESEVSQFEKILPKYSEITNTEQKNEEENERLQKCKVQNTTKEEKLKAQKIQLDELDEELKTLNKAGEKILCLEAQWNELTVKDVSLGILQDNLKELQSLYNQLHQEEKSAEAAITEWTNANNELTEKEALFFKNQAGILAEKLEEGKPCPVCGSLHHPLVAIKTQNAPTREQIEELKEKTAQLLNKMQKASGKPELTKNDISNLNEKIEEVVEKYLPDCKEETPELLVISVNKLLASVHDEMKKLTKEIEVESKNVDRKRFIENTLPEQKTQYDRDVEVLIQNKTKYESDLAILTTTISNLEKQKAELEYTSEWEAKSHLNELKTRLANLENAISSASDAFNKCNDSVSRIEGAIEQQKKELQKYEQTNLDELQKCQNQLQWEKTMLSNNRDVIGNRLSRNKTNISELKNRADELKNQLFKFNMLKHLSDTVNGASGNQGRIMLETFVQMSYLDQILIRANKRLKTMTDGVYELVRAEEIENHRAQLGLEMSVIDHHAGALRSVKGLSGGEKFQASLALALGLSDEIQEASRGIRLESMFIDEGFATLDSERLSKILKALQDLSNSNKLIGMISHVGELEDIPNFIHVTKDEKGISHVKINED